MLQSLLACRVWQQGWGGKPCGSSRCGIEVGGSGGGVTEPGCAARVWPRRGSCAVVAQRRAAREEWSVVAGRGGGRREGQAERADLRHRCDGVDSASGGGATPGRVDGGGGRPAH